MRKELYAIVMVCMLFSLVGCGDHVHKYGEWSNTKTPTCTEEGSRSRTCSKCEEVESETIPAQGHNFVNGSCTECGEAE